LEKATFIDDVTICPFWRAAGMDDRPNWRADLDNLSISARQNGQFPPRRSLSPVGDADSGPDVRMAVVLPNSPLRPEE
jgi:hypothetical protein